MWRIEINEAAERSLMKLDRIVRDRLFRFLHERVEVADDPTMLGEPLKGEFRGLWRYRVGDYRVICNIEREIRIVSVLHAGHRSDVYRRMGR